MSKIIAIIPIREFDTTKVRLTDSVSNNQRIRLNQALLKRSLASIDQSSVDHAIVVSSKPESIHASIKPSEKVTVIKESAHHGGVNLAMADGLRIARSNFGLSNILMLPSDLPLISAIALNDVTGLLEQFDLIICPSEKKDGTNLLAFKSEKVPIELHYDDDSYTKHLSEAREMKLDYFILDKPEFVHDLDTDEDIAFTMDHYRVRDFESLIEKIEQV